MTTEVVLDNEQRKAVEYPESSICIAGPGSGKTRVLTEKAKLLSDAGEDVIALTFTRAAAGEIRARVPFIAAGTIHSFAHSVFGWTGNYDNLLDKYLKKGRDKFDWVLVDEVQDLTAEQFDIVRSLVRKHIFAVGDPYQCIYMYADALGSTAINALADMTGKRHDLRNNYRSVNPVVNMLNNIYPRGLRSAGVNTNGLTSILCRRRADVEAVSEFLKTKEIGHSVKSSGDTTNRKTQFFGSEQIWVSTIHVAKGLEFDNVILYGWVPKRDYTTIFDGTDESINVYYVAMSRASLEYREAWDLEEVYYGLQTLVSNLDEIKFAEKRSRVKSDASKSVQVVLDPDWYKIVKPLLERTVDEGSVHMKAMGGTLLRSLQTYDARLSGLYLPTKVAITENQLSILNDLAGFAQLPGVTVE